MYSSLSSSPSSQPLEQFRTSSCIHAIPQEFIEVLIAVGILRRPGVGSADKGKNTRSGGAVHRGNMAVGIMSNECGVDPVGRLKVGDRSWEDKIIKDTEVEPGTHDHDRGP